MKKIEWALALTLIIFGIACLTFCATLWSEGSIKDYLTTLVHICFWTGLPGLILGVLYVIVLKGRKNK
ncbi:hypothetical protein [Oceanobacillus alkalisoli]|uniref:hypothetical protein n=1 Tax=Oceanobacillus alkalisoli TaxID=2925113 RepID=UPI001F122111|nr:hypothetical protein [Oceanobacillus alkalisoli]MCF3944874.1 hypothetical protein [Oceanobacillus alkalisoli]